MKVNNPNLSSLASTEAARAQEPSRAGRGQGTSGAGGAGDDVHLSELVRSLRSLAWDSPERQAHIDEVARAYASGGYQVDSRAVAGRVIDDAISR